MDLDLVRFGQDGHGGGGGVNPPLRFGDRHPLNSVYARFKLETRVRTTSPDIEDDLFEPSHSGLVLGEYLNLPFLSLGIACIHSVKVGRK